MKTEASSVRGVLAMRIILRQMIAVSLAILLLLLPAGCTAAQSGEDEGSPPAVSASEATADDSEAAAAEEIEAVETEAGETLEAEEEAEAAESTEEGIAAEAEDISEAEMAAEAEETPESPEVEAVEAEGAEEPVAEVGETVTPSTAGLAAVTGEAEATPEAVAPVGVQAPTDITVEVEAGPPSGPIMMNFRDASIETVLEYLSEAAGFVIVKDIFVDGRITIISKQAVSAEEAVGIVNTVLKERGYAALVMGRTLKVVPLAEAKTANVPVRAGSDPEAIEPNDSLVTQVIPLRFVDAVQLRQEIGSLIPSYADLSANASSNALILTDTQANVRRLVEIVRALDTHMADVVEVKVFQLQYANATNAARLINEVFQEDAATQTRGGARAEMMRRFRGPGGEGGQTSEAGRRGAQVTASADDRTNTVVVSAPPDLIGVIEGVIRDLDSNPAAEQAVFIHHLKNAKAATLATVLNSLFSQTQTTSAQQGAAGARGGRTSQAQAARAAFFAQMGGQAAAGAQTTDLVGQVYFVADEDSNSLTVMTASKNFDRVREIVNELDRPVPQVLIKVLIAQVTHSDTVDLGVEFSALNLRPSGLGQTVETDFGVATAEGGGLLLEVMENDVTAALRILEEVGKLDVLSRPYILASDNQAATMTVGQEVPFIRNTRYTETGQTINTIEYEDVGIILTVTPHINPDGLVIMDVVPEISTPTGDTVPISETVDAVVFAKTSAQTRVAIQDGQTIVIGGLMEDKVTDTIRKVPILGDIPLLGLLFRRTIKEKGKTELLIFITPHVAREAETLQRMSDDEVAASNRDDGSMDQEALRKHLDAMKRGGAQPPGPEEEQMP